MAGEEGLPLLTTKAAVERGPPGLWGAGWMWKTMEVKEKLFHEKGKVFHHDSTGQTLGLREFWVILCPAPWSLP